ncbi:MAG TPA: hypothetical protein VGR38_06125 [Candidatus Polarisedimenticolia bacterium]|nr:hypothetical protein [Candidatus Polarisedimenticolia bacterium]
MGPRIILHPLILGQIHERELERCGSRLAPVPESDGRRTQRNQKEIGGSAENHPSQKEKMQSQGDEDGLTDSQAETAIRLRGERSRLHAHASRVIASL